MPVSPKNDRCRGALIGLAIGDALVPLWNSGRREVLSP
jgi:hypothetical protein